MAKFYLRRVKLNSGGYDSYGSYWGIGLPLYEFGDHEALSDTIRAPNREAAKERIKLRYPNVTFLR
jgi:hypothetical protein